jgi:hypothetical protein
MERLLAIRRGSHPILSCYLRLEPQDRAGQAYLAEFRNRAKGLQSALAMLELERDERLSVERDLYRISGYLSHPRGLPHAPGIALFASEGLDLFEVCPLSRVHRTRVLLSQIPCLAELMAAEPGSLPILAVIIDRAHARLFEVTASHLVERSCPADPALRGGKFHSDREDAPGWGERGYHRRLQEEQHRHYANVVRNVEELLRARVFRGIVLAGPPEHTAGLSRFLPDTLAGRLLGVAKFNVRRLQSGELQRTSLMLAEHHDHEALKSELHDLDEEIGNDWAVNGPRETLRALHRGQVRTLYILDTQEGGGFRCSATGRLVLARGDCRGEGEAQPVANLVDEAIEEALRQRVRVVMVPKDSGGEAVDGLAAMLRFR